MYHVNTSANILVIGDLMIDHYVHGDCNRISPEAPIPVVEITHETHTLGGAGNVIKNIKALACNCNIVSVAGNDGEAERVISLLAENGVDGMGLVNDPGRCTTIKSRVLAVNHQLIRMDREVTRPIEADVEDAIMAKLQGMLNDHDIVLISDYNKGLLTTSLLAKVITMCRDVGKRVLVDPKGLDFTKYKGATLIKPNRKEAGLATGINISDRQSLENACRKLKELAECESVIVTLSEDGIAIFTNDQLTVIPTKALGVIDVTGAGDTVLASLGVAIASGLSLTEACEFANLAAAVVVSKVGSATATINEINSRLS
ncbi:D-glycero-beta-D-manno-heptose-7-phosphate kinase [Mucilaginibacter daejeonensis]|uniref:D-glycero-beta-D-manno-heptose-7-phosphate kinase n=1 Tax=Mucilaginibacter daejeonensis TaxID=398049 RepID=UPI001D17C812|nr:D-glycero-beta-D-manno-heptose-7-phosphate kinase [Mucilaginibacter daejeonensis]UEG54955.1 D-glycero-beta-D-manno-heptose-7-phosphate kinase [Mucilaginibacter daejeonensis]